MSHIWIDRNSRLKSYSAAVKGPKSVIKIEIECNEPGSLGFLLEELGNIERAQKAQAKADALAAAKPKKKPLALPAPLLQIEDMREDF